GDEGRRRRRQVRRPYAAHRAVESGHHQAWTRARSRLCAVAQLLRSAPGRPPLPALRQLRVAGERLRRSWCIRPSGGALESRSGVSILNGHTLQRQIVVATSILLLALAAAAIWSGDRTRVEHQREVSVEAGEMASLVASYLNQHFDGLD